MIDLLGWIGAIAFTVCAVPQAVQCWRQGHGEGISLLFLWIWFVGEICFMVAIPLKFGWVWWLVANYYANFICLLIILRYRLWPRGK